MYQVRFGCQLRVHPILLTAGNTADMATTNNLWAGVQRNGIQNHLHTHTHHTIVHMTIKYVYTHHTIVHKTIKSVCREGCRNKISKGDLL